MSPADLLRAYCAAFAARDLDAIRPLFAKDAVAEIPLLDERLVGHDHILRETATSIRGLRAIRVELGAIAGDGDTAMAEGVFFAELVGHPAMVDGTPARLDFRFVAVVEARAGRIVRLTEYFDTKPLKPWERQRLFIHSTRRSPYWDGAVATRFGSPTGWRPAIWPGSRSASAATPMSAIPRARSCAIRWSCARGRTWSGSPTVSST